MAEVKMNMKKSEMINHILELRKENKQLYETQTEEMKSLNKQIDESDKIIKQLKEERFSKTDYERVVAEKEDYKSRYFKTKEELEEVSEELDEVKSEKWKQHLKETDSEIAYLNEEIDKLRKYKEFVIWAEEEDDFEGFSQM